MLLYNFAVGGSREVLCRRDCDDLLRRLPAEEWPQHADGETREARRVQDDDALDILSVRALKLP